MAQKFLVRLFEVILCYGCFLVTFIVKNDESIYRTLSLAIFLVCLTDLSSLIVRQAIHSEPWFTVSSMAVAVFLINISLLVAKTMTVTKTGSASLDRIGIQIGLNFGALIVFLVDSILTFKNLYLLEQTKRQIENDSKFLREPLHETDTMAKPEEYVDEPAPHRNQSIIAQKRQSLVSPIKSNQQQQYLKQQRSSLRKITPSQHDDSIGFGNKEIKLNVPSSHRESTITGDPSPYTERYSIMDLDGASGKKRNSGKLKVSGRESQKFDMQCSFGLGRSSAVYDNIEIMKPTGGRPGTKHEDLKEDELRRLSTRNFPLKPLSMSIYYVPPQTPSHWCLQMSGGKETSTLTKKKFKLVKLESLRPKILSTNCPDKFCDC